ncbi:MAG: hypothetical protein AAGK32_14950, partial [Actinomycetota bacterium]
MDRPAEDAPRWPPGHHVVVTRGGPLLAGADPLATASPTLTVDEVRAEGEPVAPDRLIELAEVAADRDAPEWAGRWRPSPTDDPTPVPPPAAPLVARLPLVLGPAEGGFAAESPLGPVRLTPDHVAMLQAFQHPAEASTVIDAAPDPARAAALVADLVGAAALVVADRVDGAFDAGRRARQRSRLRQLRARRSIEGIDSVASGDGRVPVVGLVTSLSDFPLSLGMVLAHAAGSARLADRYSFHLVYATPADLAAVERS